MGCHCAEQPGTTNCRVDIGWGGPNRYLLCSCLVPAEPIAHRCAIVLRVAPEQPFGDLGYGAARASKHDNKVGQQFIPLRGVAYFWLVFKRVSVAYHCRSLFCETRECVRGQPLWEWSRAFPSQSYLNTLGVLGVVLGRFRKSSECGVCTSCPPIAQPIIQSRHELLNVHGPLEWILTARVEWYSR